MKISFENPVLMVDDMERAKAFYCEVLDQKVRLDFGGALIFESGLSLWDVSDDHIITKKMGKEAIAGKKHASFELNFETDDIRACLDLLKNHKVEFLHEINEEPWGQQTIRFFDPNGHLIEIGESLETFVIKFLKEGMTEEQVAVRTSVPLEKVRDIIGR